MKRYSLPILLSAILALLVSACSGVAPKQIAAAPRITPIARFPGSEQIVYHAYMELQVAGVDAAAERAARLAERYGGYYTGGQSWYVDGRKLTTIELAVPTPNFDRLRQSILELGVLLNETVSSRPVQPPPPSGSQFSSITLHLRPDEADWIPAAPPDFHSTGWNPAETFRRAFGVFLSIFGFLADVLIWIVVVAGPFILIALLIWRLLRRRAA
jgi:hypothetical protein